MIDYDEEKVLCRYVFRWHPELMTDLERRADHAAMIRAQAASTERMGAHQQAKILLEAGRVGDTEINAALAEGHEAFRLRVVRRILSDPETAAKVNRCPCCYRVLQTPTAKQCLWCNHDWHDVSA